MPLFTRSKKKRACCVCKRRRLCRREYDKWWGEPPVYMCAGCYYRLYA